MLIWEIPFIFLKILCLTMVLIFLSLWETLVKTTFLTSNVDILQCWGKEDGLIGDPFEHIFTKQKEKLPKKFYNFASHDTHIFISSHLYIVEKVLFLDHILEMDIFGVADSNNHILRSFFFYFSVYFDMCISY